MFDENVAVAAVVEKYEFVVVFVVKRLKCGVVAKRWKLLVTMLSQQGGRDFVPNGRVCHENVNVSCCGYLW